MGDVLQRAGVAVAEAARAFAALQALQPFIRRAIEGGIAIGVFLLSWKAFDWAMDIVWYADPASYALLAAPIAAVLGPLSLLQGYVLAKYIQSANGSA